MTLCLLLVDFKSVALGDFRWHEFEEDSWIDSAKFSHDFVGLDHVFFFFIEVMVI